jgi:hypothetical protein
MRNEERQVQGVEHVAADAAEQHLAHARMAVEPEHNEIPTLWLCTTADVAQTGRTVAIH